MTSFWQRFRRHWDLEAVAPPWTGSVSIFAHIQAHIAAGETGLTEGGERLPDETDDGGLRWVSGGLDGAFGHHGGVGDLPNHAESLHRAIGAVLKRASSANLTKLYSLITDASALETVDALLELLIERQDLDAERLDELAVWLAREAPDREAVKFAIALLGILQGRDHRELLLMLGRHEELTLYAAVALMNNATDAEWDLFELAQQVEGWGRIQIVERLAGTEHRAIKDWMLREGYRNSVMYEYLAHICATTGELGAALRNEAVDDELLASAGDLIQALINGGPAKDIDDFEDAAAVVERYLHHLGPEPGRLEELAVVQSILGFVSGEHAWQERAAKGWTHEQKDEIHERCDAIVALPHWPATIEEGLESDDPVVFFHADQAAQHLGLDTWEKHFARLEAGKDSWCQAMRTQDPERIDRTLALALEQLPLDEIGSGPALEMGLGSEWGPHSNLDWILQELRRFPGKGWPLIRAGARSPVVRNRHMALRALSRWGKESWPLEAEAFLTSLLEVEPDEDVRREIETLLAGERIAEGIF